MPKHIRNRLIEAYLDDEGKFYDFKTAPVTNGEYIDTSTTGVPYYNDILKSLNKPLEDINLVGKIVYMTPDEYYKECADNIFYNASVDKLKHQRGEIDRDLIEHLKQVITRFGRRFPLPYLNYANRGQEGLHRMMALAELTSWDTEFPVLVIEHADKDRAEREEHQKEIQEIEKRIRLAVREALRYHFTDYEEFKEQLDWSMEDQWRFSDNGTPKYDVVDLGDVFRISIGEAYYDVEKEDITLVEPLEIDESELDIDDFDKSDTEDFLRRYFGDSWEKDFPELKTTFNLNESLQINGVTSPEELLDWMDNNITYELVDDEYSNSNGVPTKTAEEVFETGTGHCAEQSYLEKAVLDDLGYESFYGMVKENNSQKEYGAEGSAHLFLIYLDEDNKYCWFEHSMQHCKGIHKFNSLEELFKEVSKQWWRYDKNSDILECRIIDKDITGVDNWGLAKECYKYPVKYTFPISDNVMEDDIPSDAEWDFDGRQILEESLHPNTAKNRLSDICEKISK